MFKKILLSLALFGFFCSTQALDWKNVSKDAFTHNKLILISVERDGCHYCEKMNREVFTPKNNIKKIDRYYVHKIVDIGNIKLPSSIKDVKYFPSNYILDPKTMKIIDEFPGYMKADDFISLLDTVYEVEFSN